MQSFAFNAIINFHSFTHSSYHHINEDFAAGVFVFRTMAGVLLGVLFIARGLGVCVYTHAMYDVFYYLNNVEDKLLINNGLGFFTDETALRIATGFEISAFAGMTVALMVIALMTREW